MAEIMMLSTLAMCALGATALSVVLDDIFGGND